MPLEHQLQPGHRRMFFSLPRLAADIPDLAIEVDRVGRSAAFFFGDHRRWSSLLNKFVGLVDDREDLFAIAAKDSVDRLVGIVRGMFKNMLDSVSLSATSLVDQAGSRLVDVLANLSQFTELWPGGIA